MRAIIHFKTTSSVELELLGADIRDARLNISDEGEWWSMPHAGSVTFGLSDIAFETEEKRNCMSDLLFYGGVDSIEIFTETSKFVFKHVVFNSSSTSTLNWKIHYGFYTSRVV